MSFSSSNMSRRKRRKRHSFLRDIFGVTYLRMTYHQICHEEKEEKEEKDFLGRNSGMFFSS